MENRIGKWLIDVYNQIGEIDSYLATNTTFKDYQENRMLKRATERNLMIIGEAVNRIVTHQPDIEITHAGKSLASEILSCTTMKRFPMKWFGLSFNRICLISGLR